uniref:Succinate dehydrogenase assembly factor 2, mitochondrial n=1 Tax=Ananas comosus var. bracteatus TaxID=296719 RepID=A0A6V7NPV0_ANACO|nr:unnamed protein product [Ananas comosus var. bracteatus]
MSRCCDEPASGCPSTIPPSRAIAPPMPPQGSSCWIDLPLLLQWHWRWIDRIGPFDEESKRRLYNRLLYRSKQRGFLELDLVLGNWVEENIRSMDELRIRALVDVLDLENPELWKWLTGQEQPPEAVNSNPVFSAVRSKVMQNLDKHAAPETRSSPGRPWVRGWDDKRGVDGRPIYGNQ